MMALKEQRAGPIDLARTWGACRMESADCEAFGVEAIADMFRRFPFPEQSTRIDQDPIEARIAEDEALLIERQGTVIVRVWRIGATARGLGESSLMVAFDTDLSQERRDVFADIDDPELRGVVINHGRTVLAGLDAFRSRAFALRAKGDRNSGVALYHLQMLSGGRTHRPIQARALAHWQGSDVKLIVDQPWPHGTLVRLVD
jgi:hypothetical protein